MCLVDNPGFGENNAYVDQMAKGAVGCSAAYIFLTTMGCIGGDSNAQFYKHLKSVDISKFSIYSLAGIFRGIPIQLKSLCMYTYIFSMFPNHHTLVNTYSVICQISQSLKW